MRVYGFHAAATLPVLKLSKIVRPSSLRSRFGFPLPSSFRLGTVWLAPEFRYSLPPWWVARCASLIGVYHAGGMRSTTNVVLMNKKKTRLGGGRVVGGEG